jgi:hypothetical protein
VLSVSRGGGGKRKAQKWMKEPESALGLLASCWHVLEFVIRQKFNFETC